MSKPKHIEFRAEADGELTVYQYERIYSWAASEWARLMQEIARQKIHTLHVRINCRGGDVMAGNTIFNLLQQSDVKVITYNDGQACSMGSVLLLAGDEIHMAKNAILMIHNPSGSSGGDASSHRAIADILDKLQGNMADLYTERSSHSRDEVLQLMDKETYYTAEEALRSGFIDKIYAGKVKAQRFNAEGNITPEVAEQMYLEFAAQLTIPEPIQPQPKHTNTVQTAIKESNITDMDKSKLAIMLGLPHDATEAQIEAKLKEVNAQAASLQDVQAEAEKLREAQIKALVNGAIASGKITEDKRSIFEANARNDFDLTKQILDGMSAPLKPMDVIRSQGKPSAVASSEKKFKDYGKEEIEALRKEDWEAYAKLFKAEFGYKPKQTKQIELV